MSNNNESIYHHGVPGQKWGIRRYQNKDGSLTAAGRKRADKLKDKYSKMREEYTSLTGKRLIKKVTPKTVVKTVEKQVKEKPSKKKTVQEMTDDELRARTARLRLETEYANQVQAYAKAYPKQVNKGKTFVKFVGKEMIKPAAANIGKQAFNSLFAKLGNKLLDLDKSEYRFYPNNKKKD